MNDTTTNTIELERQMLTVRFGDATITAPADAAVRALLERELFPDCLLGNTVTGELVAGVGPMEAPVIGARTHTTTKCSPWR